LPPIVFRREGISNHYVRPRCQKTFSGGQCHPICWVSLRSTQPTTGGRGARLKRRGDCPLLVFDERAYQTTMSGHAVKKLFLVGSAHPICWVSLRSTQPTTGGRGAWLKRRGDCPLLVFFVLLSFFQKKVGDFFISGGRDGH